MPQFYRIDHQNQALIQIFIYSNFPMTRQRMSIMNILEVIRANIIRDFPGITEEELQIRLNIVQNL